MQQRALGATGLKVSRLGLGTLTWGRDTDEHEARDQLVSFVDAGGTLLDTAAGYGDGAAEELIGALLRDVVRRDDVVLATKAGIARSRGVREANASRGYLITTLDASLKRLGVEAIGLYQFHRPDPSVPYLESVGALGELLDAGKIRMAGISNADPDQIRAAQDELGGRLVSVQNQYSPAFRSSLPELRLCAELGLAFLPWSPLGGIGKARDLGAHEVFATVAAAHGVSPQQVTLAWMLATAPNVVPIPGASRPETARDSAAAADLQLTGDELASLDASVDG
ncbi:MAG TPA: aldo/keto reductase [Marmoricola sp.]|nr:aldo/keto reductase [Marmoricola sp.]